MSHAEPGKSGNEVERFSRRHLRFGWWSLLLFMGLGLGLEIMHGFKLGFYLDLENETRRFMWRLAHVHGVLLGLLQIALAATLALLIGLTLQFSALGKLLHPNPNLRLQGFFQMPPHQMYYLLYLYKVCYQHSPHLLLAYR